MACRLWRKAVVNRAVAKPRLGPLGVHPARLRAPLALRDIGRVDAEHEGSDSHQVSASRLFKLGTYAANIPDYYLWSLLKRLESVAGSNHFPGFRI